jgi:hypothetical protein
MIALLSPRAKNLLLLISIALLTISIAACRETAVDNVDADNAENEAQRVRLPSDVGENSVELYYSEFCGCCGYHVDAFTEYAEAHDDLTLHLINADNPEIADMKRAAGIPLEVWSCHTTYMDGYFLEGHVPMSAVEWLLTERPDNVLGIATRHAEGEIDAATWLGQAYHIVYADGAVDGPLPAP